MVDQSEKTQNILAKVDTDLAEFLARLNNIDQLEQAGNQGKIFEDLSMVKNIIGDFMYMNPDNVS